MVLYALIVTYHIVSMGVVTDTYQKQMGVYVTSDICENAKGLSDCTRIGSQILIDDQTRAVSTNVECVKVKEHRGFFPDWFGG